MAKQSDTALRWQHEKLQQIYEPKAKASLRFFMRGGAVHTTVSPKESEIWLVGSGAKGLLETEAR